MSKKNVPLVLGASRYTGLQSFLDTVVKWIGDGGGNEDIVDVLYSFLEVGSRQGHCAVWCSIKVLVTGVCVLCRCPRTYHCFLQM